MTRPASAMVLAAGLGTRMRPLTDRVPKPLVRVLGRPLIDYALDRFEAAGYDSVVVNAHYKGEMLAGHLASRARPRTVLSQEDTLLETGGGVRRALPLLGADFYVSNSDCIWLDGKVPALERLAAAWDPERLDAVLLLTRTTSAIGYEGIGDFHLGADNVPRRRGEREIAPYVFAGVQILHRRLFDGIRDERFSLNVVYNRALQAGRLRALVHDGEWYEVGTPAGLQATEDRLAWHGFEKP
jgi:N-acetyl-alpha-D-muramate 1-phosphate uridylyltransferase